MLSTNMFRCGKTQIVSARPGVSYDNFTVAFLRILINEICSSFGKGIGMH